MDENYSEFYGHEIDESGLPFTWVENPVRTIFSLKGNPEAIIAAVNVASTEWAKKALLSENNIDMVRLYWVMGYYTIELHTNNFIPQLYDAIKAIDGIDSVNYVVYDTAYARLITDNETLGQAFKRAYKLEVDIEVDDEPLFPDRSELSLPL